MSTANREAVDAAAAAETARHALRKLLEIERMLETELPAAQAALARAEKRLRHFTTPSKVSIRRAELEVLQRKITAAKQTEVLANG